MDAIVTLALPDTHASRPHHWWGDPTTSWPADIHRLA